MALLWGAPMLAGRMGTQTARAAGDPVVAAAGDIACDPADAAFNGGLGNSTRCRQKYTSDLLINTGLTAVLPLGDDQYNCGGYNAFLQAYDLSWGRVKAITHPSAGNHEYLTSGGTNCSTNAAGYFKYFGSLAGTAGQGWYSYDVGAWHIIVLNSSCSSVGGCTSSSPQYAWLQNDLATHTNFCTLAYWHIPLFSSGGRAATVSKPFWDLLYNYNADLILNGHDHIYERFAPQTPGGIADSTRGIREFVVGTGGGNHTTISTIAANSQVRNADTFGVLRLTLHSTSYDWKFVPEAGKTFTDSGTANCHGGTVTAPTPTATSSVTSLSFKPVADAYVSSAYPSTNYGTSTSLRADASPDVRSYVRFSVSGASGHTISKVRLRLYMTAVSGSTLNALAVSDNTWGETTLTYSNRPAMGSQIGLTSALTNYLNTWVAIDVTSSVHGDGTYSFGLITPGSTAIAWGSRESTNPPMLVITFQ